MKWMSKSSFRSKKSFKKRQKCICPNEAGEFWNY